MGGKQDIFEDPFNESNNIEFNISSLLPESIKIYTNKTFTQNDKINLIKSNESFNINYKFNLILQYLLSLEM
jgi:hypothetical protein